MNEKQKSSQALCAKAIREELKQAFPNWYAFERYVKTYTKFSVRGGGYSSTVNIFWTDGPTTSQVEEITEKYQYGHFDGMIDCYEFSNKRNDIPQAKFVFAKREYSEDIILKTAKTAQANYGDLAEIKMPETKEDLSISFSAFSEFMNWHQLTWKILRNIDLTGAVNVIRDEKFVSGSMFEGFKAARGDEK